jgi:hypothetical protein
MIGKNNKTLNIVYDAGNIRKYYDSKGEVERFRQLLTLHETGHARLHLKDLWIRLSDTAERKVKATPVQETEAWIYAYGFLGLIRGLRGRINRIMGRFDDAIIDRPT